MNIYTNVELDARLVEEEEDETDTWPTLNRPQCGVFIGEFNFGMWENAGSGGMPDWYAYCRDCI